MSQHPPPHTGTDGFTLIEMTMVLVVTAILFGTIFVGQELIESSKIRSTISQVQAYKAAADTFYNKYGGLPGDLLATTAAQFNFTTRTGAAQNGDGNGHIENCGNAVDQDGGCETALVWSDLSMAGLIPGSYTTATDATLPNLTIKTIPLYYPLAKIGNTNVIILTYVLPPHGSTLPIGNAFVIVGLQSTNAIGLYSGLTPDLTPYEAYSIDYKMDDGMPNAGDVQYVSASPTSLYTQAGAPCIQGAGSSAIYNTMTTANASTEACGLWINSDFPER